MESYITPCEIFYDFFQVVDIRTLGSCEDTYLFHSIQYDDLLIYPYLGKIFKEGKEIHGSMKHDGKFLKFRQKALHRIIYEAYYNIKLTQKDVINHINGDYTDNRITNLILR